MSNYKRTAREIKVPVKNLVNKNINVRVGTVEERDSPKTIYIFISFWLRPKEEFKLKSQDFLKSNLEYEFKKIYNLKLKKELIANKFFTNEKENIFMRNIPDNLNYNNKRNFISLELYLHTSNIISQDKIPLSAKKNTALYNEAVRISNIIGNSELLQGNQYFNLNKTST